MPQMYKVFFNNNRLYISKKQPKNVSISIEYIYINKLELKHFLFEKIKNKKNKNILILCDDKDDVWETFTSFFTVKEAAGGLAINNKKELLFIKRRGLWDLPKGHIEENEKKRVAALREVSEECGIKKLRIIEKITVTYHCYYIKSKPIIKPTHWYLMSHPGKETPTPQIKEDITIASWTKKNKIKKLLGNSFPTIPDVVEKANF